MIMQDKESLVYDDLRRALPIYFKTQYDYFEHISKVQELYFHDSKEYVTFFQSSFPFLNDHMENIKALIQKNIIHTQENISQYYSKNGSLSTFLSDPHHQWDVVRMVQCHTTHKKGVYKKGALRNYLIYENFIKKFKSVFPASVESLHIHHDHHGEFLLQEYIETDHHFGDDHLFNYQIGFLSILLYLLSATDAHFENFILSKKGLCFVDIESIFQPLKKKDITNEVFSKSVYSTGVLPFEIDVPLKGKFDFSPISEDNWFSMPPHFKKTSIIKEGMRDAIQFITTHYTEILDYFNEIATQEYTMRVTIKPTLCYGLVLNKLSEKGWSDSENVTYQALQLLNKEETHAQPIIEEEMRMILNYQIPIFYSSSRSTHLITDSLEIKNYFEKPGIDRSLDRLHTLVSLDHYNMIQQLKI